MFTRQQYLNKECTYQEYYRQLVTPGLVNIVANHFGVDNLIESSKKDYHFKSIELQRWDNLAALLSRSIRLQFRELGDYPTIAGWVCVLKQAADIAIEGKDKNHE